MTWSDAARRSRWDRAPSVSERLWSHVKKDGPFPSIRPELGPCWLWQGYRNEDGYGVIEVNGKAQKVHRVAFGLLGGEIPEGFVLDHLCRVAHCVNPSHLELVTGRENTLRGVSVVAVAARVTHCPAGHAYDEGNTRMEGGRRRCRECQILRARKRRSLRKLQTGVPS